MEVYSLADSVHASDLKLNANRLQVYVPADRTWPHTGNHYFGSFVGAMPKYVLIFICLSITGAIRSQPLPAGRQPLVTTSTFAAVTLGYGAKPGIMPAQNDLSLFFQAGPGSEDCALLRKKRRETRIALIGVTSLGVVLMGVAINDAFSHLNISGNGGGGSVGGQFAGTSGLLFFLGGSIGYAVTIPSLNRKYKHCRAQ